MRTSLSGATKLSRGLFVTATDTGAGKTTLLCRLIPALEKAHLDLRVRKPVESGCRFENNRLIAADAAALARVCSRRTLSAEQVCAYRLRACCSPARAAKLENFPLSIDQLADACHDGNTTQNTVLLVEGAGGLYSPIAQDGDNADLAVRLALPLLIVVENRLGCINHALLTIEAAHHRDLEIAALVLNQTMPDGTADTDNQAELSALTDIRVFKTAYYGHNAAGTQTIPTDIKALAAYLLRYLAAPEKAPPP